MAEVAGGVLAVHPPIRQHSNAHLFDSTFPAVRDSGKPSRRRRISRTAHFQPQFLTTDSVSYMDVKLILATNFCHLYCWLHFDNDGYRTVKRWSKASSGEGRNWSPGKQNERPLTLGFAPP